VLIPNAANQKIEIFVTGTEQVSGMNFNLQVADGGTAVGGSVVGPKITGVDLISDSRMVFYGNNTQPTDPGSSVQLAIRTVTTASGTVTANGLVAIVTLDTTGIALGTYSLKLGATANGSTDFVGVAIAITEGTLVVESRPSKIVIGNHQLQPNTAGQQIQLYVTGNDQVGGMNFNLQVADGGPAAGGTVAGPAITAVDLVSQTGMIFFGNSTQPVDPGSVPQVAIRSLTTASGLVTADGLVATVTLDTTGVASGTYSLKMGATVNGASDFGGIPITIVEGTITVIAPIIPPDITLHIRKLPGAGSTMIEVSFDPAAGWNHTVQYRDNLLSGTSWQDLPGGPHNSGVVTDTPGTSGRFYQLRILSQ